MSCASDVESLTLFGCWIELAAPPTDSNQTHSVRHDRPKLRELSLSFCAGVTGLLLQAFDFTHIPFIRCEASWSPEVELFMHEIGGSVKNIAVAPRDRELFHIPIKDYFPALECITSTALPCAARVFDDDEVPPDTSNPPAAPLISMIKLLPPDNMVTRIVIQTEVDHLEMESFQTYVPELEDVIITQLPALQAVEIQVNPWQYVYQDTGFDWPYEKVVTQARKVFPRIAGRNLLFVCLG
ncbi:hypothetical protein R3P38DRAFT_3488073 [Favolaschia claudopus]|uniref:Uncharacterized protein n=1 Tax=Favolaschia claudopus TaxID=2862362 RepID=A0AAV9Z632_9AGAR